MSVITDVVIITSPISESAAIAYLNRWLMENDSREQQLCQISMDAAGGYKVFTGDVWAASFSYLDVYGLVEAIREAPWDDPRAVFAYIDPGVGGQPFVVCPATPGEFPGERSAQPAR